MNMVKIVEDEKCMAIKATGDVLDALNAVAKSLREVSASALELSEDASVALSNASSEVVRIAETLRKSSVDAAKGAARQAAHEAQEHPIASVAAALTAIGALVGVIVAARSRKGAPR
jgi:ElaB/YqjD/DUF883 family membrane-anchored ribosome-binding protein